MIVYPASRTAGRASPLDYPASTEDMNAAALHAEAKAWRQSALESQKQVMELQFELAQQKQEWAQKYEALEKERNVFKDALNAEVNAKLLGAV